MIIFSKGCHAHMLKWEQNTHTDGVLNISLWKLSEAQAISLFTRPIFRKNTAYGRVRKFEKGNRVMGVTTRMHIASDCVICSSIMHAIFIAVPHQEAYLPVCYNCWWASRVVGSMANHTCMNWKEAITVSFVHRRLAGDQQMTPEL